MFDSNVALRELLIASTELTNLVPVTNIVSGDLPQGANPEANEVWLTFRTRGGKGHEEIQQWRDISFSFTVWAQPNGDVAARTIYNALYDVLYNALNVEVDEATVVCAKEEVAGQDVTDPADGWAMCVSYWLISLRANS